MATISAASPSGTAPPTSVSGGQWYPLHVPRAALAERAAALRAVRARAAHAEAGQDVQVVRLRPRAASCPVAARRRATSSTSMKACLAPDAAVSFAGRAATFAEPLDARVDRGRLLGHRPRGRLRERALDDLLHVIREGLSLLFGERLQDFLEAATG